MLANQLNLAVTLKDLSDMNIRAHSCMTPKSRCTQTGVTLVEMLVVMAIVGVLAALSGPSFVRLIQTTRMDTRAESLLAIVNQARAEAIAQRRVVTVCGSLDGVTCNNGGWSANWLSFIDMDGDGVIDNGGANPDRVLKTVTNSHPNITTQRTGANPLRFNSQGFSVDTAAQSIWFCDERGATASRGWIVTAIGRLNPITDTDSPPDGIGDDHTNSNVTCP